MPSPAAQIVALLLQDDVRIPQIWGYFPEVGAVTGETKWPVWLMLFGSRNPGSEVKSTYKQGPLAEWIF